MPSVPSESRIPEIRFPLLALNRLRMLTDGEGVTTLAAGAGGCAAYVAKDVVEELIAQSVTTGFVSYK